MKSRKTKPATKKTILGDVGRGSKNKTEQEADVDPNRTSLLEKKMKAYIYINPNAPAEVELVAEHFLDVSRVSSVFMQEVTGGFVDEGPPLSAYAAVLLDEEGELHLLEPVIP